MNRKRILATLAVAGILLTGSTGAAQAAKVKWTQAPSLSGSSWTSDLVYTIEGASLDRPR